jgi:hypothetical protein
MFQRENAIGFLLLGVCAFMGGILVYSIVTGTSYDYTGPRWLSIVLFVLFIGGILYGLKFGMRGRSNRTGHWPDPMTGRRGWRNRSDQDNPPGPDTPPNP